MPAFWFLTKFIYRYVCTCTHNLPIHGIQTTNTPFVKGPLEKSCIQGHFYIPQKCWIQAYIKLENDRKNLMIFGGGKSTFKHLLLFIKTKVSAIFKLWTCRFVNWSYTHCATKMYTNLWWHNPVSQLMG